MDAIFEHNSGEFDAYFYSQIPDQRDTLVEQVLAEILAGSRADGEAVRSRSTLEDSQVFNAFAQRMAVRAVRDRSTDLLRMGLLSLAMAGALDYRENLMVLSLVARSADKLGSSLTSVIDASANLLPERALLRFRDFASWPEADRNIRAMGFAESGVGDEFTYVRASSWA